LVLSSINNAQAVLNRFKQRTALRWVLGKQVVGVDKTDEDDDKNNEAQVWELL